MSAGSGRLRPLLARLPGRGETPAARVVPPTGFTARLTLFTAAAMSFLAVFAVAMALAAGQLADRWQAALSQGATIRISAPADQIDAQTAAVLRVLETTPGVASARRLDDTEMRGLLAPWFGADLPVEALPLPHLVEVTETGAGFEAEGLRLRLAAEAPGAVLDDHARWRRPLVAAAERVRAVSLVALVLIALVLAAMVTLAAQAALAANGQVIRVLRLIGAEDRFISAAFVRRFTARALAGSVAGTLAGLAAVALMPGAAAQTGLLAGLGLSGQAWLWPLAVPPVVAALAFGTTWMAAARTLRRTP